MSIEVLKCVEAELNCSTMYNVHVTLHEFEVCYTKLNHLWAATSVYLLWPQTPLLCPVLLLRLNLDCHHNTGQQLLYLYISTSVFVQLDLPEQLQEWQIQVE